MRAADPARPLLHHNEGDSRAVTALGPGKLPRLRARPAAEPDLSRSFVPVPCARAARPLRSPTPRQRRARAFARCSVGMAVALGLAERGGQSRFNVRHVGRGVLSRAGAAEERNRRPSLAAPAGAAGTRLGASPAPPREPRSLHESARRGPALSSERSRCLPLLSRSSSRHSSCSRRRLT